MGARGKRRRVADTNTGDGIPNASTLAIGYLSIDTRDRF